MPDLDSRVDLLERMQAQQVRLNDQLEAGAAPLRATQEDLRTSQEQLRARVTTHQERLVEQRRMVQILAGVLASHEDRQAEHAQRLAQHAEQMAELRAILQAIKDLLDRGNGH